MMIKRNKATKRATGIEKGQRAEGNVFTRRLKSAVGIMSKILKIIIPIYFLLALVFYFGARGLLYFFIGFALYVTVRIALNFNEYLNVLRYGEMKVFGKPLDREHWKDEKPRLPRVVWKKKDERTTDKRRTGSETTADDSDARETKDSTLDQ